MTSKARKVDTISKGLSPVVLELMASRVCHDLISPVGAVHNGVEFLQEAGLEQGNDAVELIAHSALQAAAKLQAFRLAYGAGGRDSNIKTSDVKKTFAALIDADGKVTQDWDATSLNTEALPLGFCKILMGTLMLAQECLPKGGVIKVSNESPTRVLLSAEGTDANIRPLVREALALELPLDDLDSRLVHPFILGTLAAHYGFRVEMAAAGAGKVVIHLSAL